MFCFWFWFMLRWNDSRYNRWNFVVWEFWNQQTESYGSSTKLKMNVMLDSSLMENCMPISLTLFTFPTLVSFSLLFFFLNPICSLTFSWFIKFTSFLNFMHQRHPFSLTSAPDDEHLSMHIRSLGDWSYQMYSIFQKVFNFLSILREETVETEKHMMRNPIS